MQDPGFSNKKIRLSGDKFWPEGSLMVVSDMNGRFFTGSCNKKSGYLCSFGWNDLCDPSHAPIPEPYFYTMGVG
jgi:hypothetical protein